jgi:hypothetical protein
MACQDMQLPQCQTETFRLVAVCYRSALSIDLAGGFLHILANVGRADNFSVNGCSIPDRTIVIGYKSVQTLNLLIRP